MTENKSVTEKKAGSKFSGLMAAVKDRQEDVPEAAAAIEEVVQKAYTEHTGSIQAENNLPSAKRGRPRGKRSSEDFVQVTAYIGRGTHRSVKMALLGVGEDREFSELVEDLLTQWLQSGR